MSELTNRLHKATFSELKFSRLVHHKLDLINQAWSAVAGRILTSVVSTDLTASASSEEMMHFSNKQK